jgi:hypothetical protein
VQLWYNSTYNGWGLAFIDTATSTSLWQHYIYPAPGTALSYEGPHAEIITELETAGQLNDGVTLFRHPEVQDSGSAWKFFTNSGAMSTTDTVNYNTCHTVSSNSAPNSNDYAYHTWVNRT